MPVYQRLLVRAGSECRRDAANAFGAVGEAAFGAISFFREREDIALELAKGIGIRAIARKLGRPPSTISREVRRNAATRSGNLDYRPVPPNGTPIVSPGGLLASWRSIRLCVNMLRSAWPAKSPTPMAPHSRAPRWVWKNDRAGGGRQPGAPSRSLNRLQIDYPEDQTMRISHETIYQSLYIQGRGALRRGLTACLRSGRALRVPRERAYRANGPEFATSPSLETPL